MTGFGVEYIWVLALLPLALAPLLRSPLRASRISSSEAAPRDALSRFVAIAIKALGVGALGAAIFAAAGPYRSGAEYERVGEGADVVFLIDRSGSMNETFAGRTPSGSEESKASAARRLLQGFVDRRGHDRVGVVGFSTAPMLLMPMSDHREAIAAAIDAVDRPGLDYTNIGRGLAMALALIGSGAPDRSRAIVLVSDGAGVIDPRIQDDLRAEMKKANVNLYWLFLRTAGSAGIYDKPDPEFDTPQAAPERHLDLFFKSLRVPYRAFEAEGPEATEQAIAQIDRLERRPVLYVEKRPRDELSGILLAVALAATLALLLAKLSEARLPMREERA
ncbi:MULTISPECIES: vWA domain-containing protein [Methylosinus]|uniref:VWA domain-containing protein n=1 Tax=Methylosinus trichosporium (strain ATCC 35070 / NCIMB 11131 / UNIQEM 75 / OB3b) TaxID=595536 RepID=A0A2D2D1U1_METT3|nr:MULTISPECIES: vWA domain-containing protein [Methylosinus]ATQ68950.1 VWA domain-containing protein [Methylosinus trichosporium OB3b]OBS52260.1 VWA domain-containing protein [Methylosinus sp. 3S-1]